MQINHITVRSERIRKPLTLAVCTDFHNGRIKGLARKLAGVDAVLVVGDLVDRHAKLRYGYENAVRFLEEVPEVAPVFYSIGNHDRLLPRREEYWPHVERSRVTVLDNDFVEFGGIVLGGLSSRRDGPETAWLSQIAARDEFRLLLCHHPEYYQEHVLPYDIDLTLAGHAHGGQVRLGRQGAFAPGQGLLPKWTSGFYFDDRLLVSRGMTNATWAPRINCPCEMIILHLEPKEASHA